MAVVYTHTRLDTNVIFYVGIGKTEKRAYAKTDRSKYWKNIVDKAGYSIKIVHECETWDEACYTEKYLISYYGRKDLKLGELVNLTNGGDGNNGLVFSEEHRAKLSVAGTGRKPSEETLIKLRNRVWSEESRTKISVSLKGKKHSEESIAKMRLAATNRKVSDETRTKMSLSQRGRKHSEETLIKISKGNKGKVYSDETRAKIAASKKGIKLSDEHRAKLSAAHKGIKLSDEHRTKISEAGKKRLENLRKNI